MAAKAITSLGSERTESKGPVWNVAIDCIATWNWQTVASACASAASAKGTNLKAPQFPSAFIHHHHHLHLPRLHQRHHVCLLRRHRGKSKLLMETRGGGEYEEQDRPKNPTSNCTHL